MKTTPKPRLAVLSLACATAACGIAVWWFSTKGDVPVDLPLASSPVAASQDPAAASAASPTTRSDAVAHPGYYGAPVGASFRYDLTGTFEYGVGHPESGQQRSGMQLRAALQVAVVDRRADAILLRAELRDLALAPLAGNTGGDDSGLGRAASQPFHARIDQDGRVHGYQFASDLDGEQRNFVRGLFAALLHTVPHDAPASWEAEDRDAAGVFVARFDRDVDGDTTRVGRRKLRYTAMAGDELHPHTITGGSTASFDASIRWLRDVDVDERTTLTIQGLGLAVEVRSVLHAVLVASSTEAMPAADALWDAAFAPAAGHQEDLGDSHAASERAQWQQRLAGTSIEDLVTELSTLLAADPRDAQAIDRAWQALTWLVRLDPEVAAAIHLRVSDLPTELADILVSALGAAGTDAAQDVLAAMRRDAASTAALRTSATVALFQLGKPGQRVLGELVADLSAAGELRGDAAMAMLALGALAPRAVDARIDGRSALQALLDLEGKTAGQGRADLWLNALANVGTADVLPHVQRYVGHDDEQVRAAAYNALRRVDSAPAVALLQRGLDDASPVVRTDVVNALGQHRSPAACDALIRVAHGDRDATVRRATLDGLASFARTTAAAREAIERMASTDRDQNNQRAARTVLDGLR